MTVLRSVQHAGRSAAKKDCACSWFLMMMAMMVVVVKCKKENVERKETNTF